MCTSIEAEIVTYLDLDTDVDKDVGVWSGRGGGKWVKNWQG